MVTSVADAAGVVAVIDPGPGQDMSVQGRVLEYIRTHRRNRLVRKVASFSRAVHLAFENSSYDPATNGEEFLLRVLAAERPLVVFDVGANVGDWAKAARRHLSSATVHCFEIVRATRDALTRNVADDTQIVVSACGLSDVAGEVPVRFYPSNIEISSVVDYPHDREFIVERCPVTTGDSYVAANHIERIDLLKVDTEGAEGLVLDGFIGAFDAGRVRVVQFEYGYANIVSRRLLRDHYAFLEARDYRVGKLYPDYVDFRAYDLKGEDFIGPNYVAVHASDVELLHRLQHPR